MVGRKMVAAFITFRKRRQEKYSPRRIFCCDPQTVQDAKLLSRTAGRAVVKAVCLLAKAFGVLSS